MNAQTFMNAEQLIKKHYNSASDQSLIPSSEISTEVKEEIFDMSDREIIKCYWTHQVPGHDPKDQFLHVYDIHKVYRSGGQ
jgi:hypothetical protein